MNKTLLLSVAIFLGNFTLTPFANANEAESRAPTWAELTNASYTGLEQGAIRLSGGNWEGEPYMEGAASRPRAGLVEDVYFTGDLNGDGVDEAVVILWQSAGGTGSNSYIAVMSMQNGDVVNIGTALIGDRVKLRSWKLSNAVVSLNVLQAGESDAMCCPTMLATRNWSFQESKLEEGVLETRGTLSLATLDGSEWALTHMDWNKPVAEGIEITLGFSGDRLAGKSACNRYSASIEEGDSPGSIKIGQSMGTRMACPENIMDAERKYLNALSQVKSFSFHVGSLVLSGSMNDESRFNLLFTSVVKGEP